MQDLAEAMQATFRQERRAVVARVVGIKGFSTVPVDRLVAVDDAGNLFGELLGRPGAEQLRRSAAALLGGDGPARLDTVTIAIHGPAVAELGLSCGGQAEVLMQPTASIPPQLWELLGARAPVSLVTWIEGAAAGPDALVVDGQGRTWGELPGAERLATEAAALLAEGRTDIRRIEVADGVALLEAWVPDPRLVVLGAGDVAAAIEVQASLLGWETRATEQLDELAGLFDWAGVTAALVVLTHDPHLDVPALAAALGRGIPYTGAMGSRRTQSRRLERLAAEGLGTELTDRIHRPIGLDLGGRKAPEVALAVVAEILATHHGRPGGSLKHTSGPIHGPPRQATG
jgi:xanthine dehydrogenase accessory factor